MDMHILYWGQHLSERDPGYAILKKDIQKEALELTKLV